MFRSLLLAACMVAGVSASASPFTRIAQSMLKVQPFIRFVVGDTANYNLSVSSMSGTMVMKVTQVDASGVTITQDMNLGAMGQENVVEVINPQTGEVISVTVNGQKQNPPDPNDIQITGSDIGNITVPAGTFPCQDVKFHSKSQNTDGEQWVDMDDVPVGGMLKLTTTQQGMPIVIELTSFSRGN